MNIAMTLAELAERSKTNTLLVYQGADNSIVKLASEERPIVMISRTPPRRDAELIYLRTYANIEQLPDDPKVLKYVSKEDLTIAQEALAFRVNSILLSDYFLDADIQFGTISHGLPILVTSRKPANICLPLASSEDPPMHFGGDMTRFGNFTCCPGYHRGMKNLP